MPDCSDIRKQWDEAFDSGRNPSTRLARHIADCDGCRSYAAAATGLRDTLRQAPLPPSDEVADLAVLAALRADSSPVRSERRSGLSLVFAGAASFVLTLIVAGVMLEGACGTPAPVTGTPEGVARTPLPETSAELDSWLEGPGLITGVRTLRTPSVPAPTKRSPLRGSSRPPESVA